MVAMSFESILVSDSPATPNLTLRLERQEWTCVPVKFCVMDIQWGVLRFERQYRDR